VSSAYAFGVPTNNVAKVAAVSALGTNNYTTGAVEVGGGDFGGDFGADAPISAAPATTLPEEFRELMKDGPCWTRTSDPLLKRSTQGSPTTGHDRLSPRRIRRRR